MLFVVCSVLWCDVHFVLAINISPHHPCSFRSSTVMFDTVSFYYGLLFLPVHLSGFVTHVMFVCLSLMLCLSVCLFLSLSVLVSVSSSLRVCVILFMSCLSFHHSFFLSLLSYFPFFSLSFLLSVCLHFHL